MGKQVDVIFIVKAYWSSVISGLWQYVCIDMLYIQLTLHTMYQTLGYCGINGSWWKTSIQVIIWISTKRRCDIYILFYTLPFAEYIFL